MRVEIKGKLWKAVATMRDREPLILCLTNYVVNNFTANMLLAAGASPIMAGERSEMRELAKLASAILLNIGTLDRLQFRAMKKVLTVTRRTQVPVVLDMVGVGASQWRRSSVRYLLEKGNIAIVRGNASEILAVGSNRPPEPSGVDAMHDSDEALDNARIISNRYETVVAMSGKQDYIVSGDKTIVLENGHIWLTKITGVGCALGALMAAVSSCSPSSLIAAAAATSYLNIAGEIAAKRVISEKLGLASMQAHLLDQIYILQEMEFEKLLKNANEKPSA